MGRLNQAGAAVAAALLLLLAGCSGSPDRAPADATVSTPAPATDPVAFGAWAQPVGGHGPEQQKKAVLDLEQVLGHKLAIDHFFVPQFAPATTFAWRLKWDAEAGRTPMISFGYQVDTLRITHGDFDGRLQSYAQAIEKSGAKRVLIRYAHEMDGKNNRDWVHGGAEFVAAWNHVRGIFQGLPVQFVWSPNAPAFGGANGGVDAYWPGDQQVDWIAADGYNFNTCDNHTTWKPFATIFDPFLKWSQGKGKPLMIAEFGSVQDPDQPNRQAQWISDAVAQANRTTALRALVYYSSDGHECDWRLDSSPATQRLLTDLGTTAQVVAEPS